ncbi:MAG TPA: SDR family oxidoreductase [Chloroflexota bacterium]|nr:SDR family oxidoreductase [Chloroflexota bacterium]
MSFSFTGKVALVTGAAHGIGRSICVELARCGAHVSAADVLRDELETTVDACAAAGGTCRSARLDVTDGAAVHRLAAEIGPVDILVNVAGGVLGQVGKPIEEVTDEEFAAIVAVNLTGAFNCARAVAPGMKARRYGRIVNISSGAGRSTSLTGIQAYTSAKAGQIGLTRQLAQELGPWGITVNNIAPGFIRSNPTTERQWESYGEEGRRALVADLALRRLGTPEDIAYGVLFFASDYAGWCTGQVLSIDGGKAMF